MSFTATGPGTTEEGAGSVTFELWDYGEAVEIELPQADDVVDESALAG